MKNRNRLLLVLLSIAIIAIAALAVVREARKPDPIPDYALSEKSSETTVVIPEGATGDQIAKLLFEKDVVKSGRAFFAAATADDSSKGIQPGTYRLSTKIPGREALAQLLDKERRMLVLIIREGERIYELRDDLLELDFKPSEVRDIFESKTSLPGFGERAFEGFLFPATYNLTPNETVASIRDRLIDKFLSVTQRLDLVSKSKAKGLSPYDALVIASIVQAEGFSESDFGKVARVIFNRLELGMPLQMDSTVLYALKERRLAVSRADISIASAYNTYNRKGLPPTPIGNPGESALRATLEPEPGDWLYFVTVAPTETKFTNSYTEFLSFKREFKRNLKAGIFDGKS